MSITADEDVLHGAPRLDGTRISVLHVYDMVIEGEGKPAAVADALDVDLGQVHEALAYYYNHPEEMRRHRRREAAATDELSARAVKPPVELDGSR